MCVRVCVCHVNNCFIVSLLLIIVSLLSMVVYHVCLCCCLRLRTGYAMIDGLGVLGVEQHLGLGLCFICMVSGFRVWS